MKNILLKKRLLKGMIPLLCLLLFPTFVFAQKLTVSGQVKDALGEPVIGANVVVKGTTNGAMTDLDGMFTINEVEKGSTIVVSFIGYLPQSIVVSGNAPLSVTLAEDNQALDEVVVIGYGVQKKSVVTASIAKVGADELAQTAPVRVDNALKGLAAGVQVTTQNGQPGTGSVIRVRGTGTINTADPLYIVDGMPINGGIDNINPADIASIEVLKDAASAAVYGSRAANGVVLVTTKQGAIGKVKVSYDFSYGWQSAWKKRSMLNASEYATLMNEAQQYSNGTDRFSNTNLGVGTDWQDVLFNDGAPVQNHQLSISGANEKVSYYFSAGYYNQEGIIGGNYDRSNYERLSFRSNTLYTLFDETKNRSWLRKMTVGVNMSYSRINNIGVSAGNLTGSPLGDALFLDPTMEVYAQDEDHVNGYTADIRSKYGDPVRDQLTGQVLQIPENFNEITNPLGRMSAQPGRKNNSDKVIANLTAELGIWDNLKYKFSWGSDLAFWGYDEWNHPYYLGRNCNQSIADGRSSVMSEMNRGYTWQIENVLTYDKTISQHTFNVVLGQSAERNTGRRLYGMAKDLIAYMGDKANIDFTTSLPNNGNRNTEGGLTDPHSLASYFGRLSYNFAERYMLQLTVRRDGSSRFGNSL